jgi:hypothetical protein
MITIELYTKAVSAINALHETDINLAIFNGSEMPSELVYSQRMLETLSGFSSNAGFALQLAVQCEHIERWKIARNLFPMDKPGYFQWRRAVMEFQLSRTVETLKTVGIDDADSAEVIDILSKKGKEKNVNAQIVEDVACIVFVQWYLEAFAAKHDFEKVVDIVRKTVKKMSNEGLNAVQAKPLSDYVHKVLAAL